MLNLENPEGTCIFLPANYHTVPTNCTETEKEKTERDREKQRETGVEIALQSINPKPPGISCLRWDFTGNFNPDGEEPIIIHISYFEVKCKKISSVNFLLLGKLETSEVSFEDTAGSSWGGGFFSPGVSGNNLTTKLVRVTMGTSRKSCPL